MRSQLWSVRLQGESARNNVLEISRTGTEVIVVPQTIGPVNLISHPLVWFETGPQYEEGRAEIVFDRIAVPVLKDGSPYPVDAVVRRFIKGCLGTKPSGFINGSLDAMIPLLKSGGIHLFTHEQGFIARFHYREDALMIADAMHVHPILFSSLKELQKLPEIELAFVINALDPDRKHPKLKEIFSMAEKAMRKEAATPKVVAKAASKQRRADGPVATARAIFTKMKDKTTAEIKAECEKAGINPGTVGVQLGKWRKENGIVVKRGGTNNTKAKAKAQPPAPSAAKAKAATKKTAAGGNASPSGADSTERPSAVAKAKSKKPTKTKPTAPKVTKKKAPKVDAPVGDGIETAPPAPSSSVLDDRSEGEGAQA